MATFTQLDLFGNPIAAPAKEAKKPAKKVISKPNTPVALPENEPIAAVEIAPDITIPLIYKQPETVFVQEAPVEIMPDQPIESSIAVAAAPLPVIETSTDTIISFETPTHVKSAIPVIKRRGRKSQKQMELDAAFINVLSDELLFQKQYYTMGQVCAMFNVNHSLLRYWETEFSILKPRKNRKGDRLFRPEDVKNIEIIYRLTRVKKLTIQGAKDYFKNEKLVAKKFELVQQMEQVRYFLLELKAKL